MKNRFSVVIIDDDSPEAFVERHLAKDDLVGLQIIWVKNPVPQYRGADPQIWSADAFEPMPEADWSPDILLRGDVAIIDLSFTFQEEAWLSREAFDPSAIETLPPELQKICAVYGGARFVVGMEQALQFQQVMLRTRYGREDTIQEALLGDWVDPRPGFLLFHKDQDPRTGELIRGLYEGWARGFGALKDMHAVDFAGHHDLPVLIVGESGTGKEGIARAIHRRWSIKERRPRRDPPFVAVNCPALSEELARPELFGYVQGSFTGATRNEPGLLLGAAGITVKGSKQKKVGLEAFKSDLTDNTWLERLPQGSSYDLRYCGPDPVGTLFLDEIGDLSPRVQALLLRFLESGEVVPVGYRGAVTNLRFRLIAATSDPEVASKVGVALSGRPRGTSLRNDLLARIRGQLIVANELNANNLDSHVRTLLKTVGQEKWSHKGVVALKDHVKERIEESSEDQPFGQYREVRNVILLAEAYSRSAEDRGFRRRTDVEQDDVRAVTQVAAVSPIMGTDLGQLPPKDKIMNALDRRGGKYVVWQQLFKLFYEEFDGDPIVFISKKRICSAAEDVLGENMPEHPESNLNESGLKELNSRLAEAKVSLRTDTSYASETVKVVVHPDD